MTYPLHKKNTPGEKGVPIHRLLYQFRVREGSQRAKLLAVLGAHSGEQLPYTEVMDAVYGKKKGSKQSFGQLICKIDDTIEARQLPYELRRQRTARGRTIGLYSIEHDNRSLVPAGGTIAAFNSKNWGEN